MNQQNPSVSQPAILLAAISAGRNENSKRTLYALETAFQRRFPGSSIYTALFSRRQEPYNREITAAIGQAASSGIRTLVVQPVCLLRGAEYSRLADWVEQCLHRFSRLVILISKPLLANAADLEAVRKAVTERMSSYHAAGTAVCLVGHGGDTADGNLYAAMQRQMLAAGCRDYFIGTVKAGAGLSLECVKKTLKESGGYRRVVLVPFMISAGFHAYRDIAGEQEGSWKRVLEQEGYETVCVLEGLGQIPAIQDLFAAHTQAALEGRQ